MSLVNFTSREITCKIVYYGPGRSGKTTNLQYVYDRVPEGRRGRMVSLATQTDRTLFFDFLPLELGSISGFATKFQLYTVPGQSYYNATRKLVLQGADGVVFVADSQARRFDDNLESLQNLQDNLLTQGVDIRQLPVVFQYNKQDLPRDLILTHEEMDDALNFRAVQSYAGDALHGTGVFETLRGISEQVLKRLAAGSGRGMTVTLNPLYRFDTYVVGCGEPPGRHGGQGRGRIAGHGVQPPVHLRPPRPGEDAPPHGRGPRGPRDRPEPPRSSISPSMSSWRPSMPRSPPVTARRTGSDSSTWICCWWTTSSSSPTGARCRRSCSGSPTRCRPPIGRSSSPATARQRRSRRWTSG